MIQKGYVKPADSYWTSDPNAAVKLRMEKHGLASKEPLSLPYVLAETVRTFGSYPALRYKDDKKNWQTITYIEYQRRIYHMAKVFIQLGLKRHHSVSVLAGNCKEWVITNSAVIHAGGIISGIYVTSSAEASQYILECSRANICIVDDPNQMEKIHAIKDKIPDLKAIIQINGPFADYVQEKDGYYKWHDLENLTISNDTEDEFDRRLENIAVNECSSLVFTSGTTGNPKGVMLSQDNLIWNNKYTFGTRLDSLKYGKEVTISYLPLNHMAAQILDIYIPIIYGGLVYFADKNALKDGVIQMLQESRPTRFLGVPRVYEKIRDIILMQEKMYGPIIQWLLKKAKEFTLNYHLARIEGRTPTYPWLYKFLKNFLWSNFKKQFGLERGISFLSGAAPMSLDTKYFYLSIDIKIFELYGLSETTGPHCGNSQQYINLNSVGREFEGVQTKVVKETGELMMNGRNIFMGYINNFEKTNEAFSSDNWLYSGDIGHVDDERFLYINGRMKEIIITSGGENIPPVYVEHLVKSELPIVNNAFLVGDKRKYLTMLLALKTEMDSDTGAPRDKLHPETIHWMRDLGLSYKKLSDVLKAGPDPKVLQALDEGIKRANKKALSNAQKVQKFALLPHDFSLTTGELSDTFKLKRDVVTKMYKDLIEKMYE